MHLLPSLLLQSAALAAALHKPPRLPSYLHPREAASINASDYPAHTVPIPIDHYSSTSNTTYPNRYWLNTQYYRPGGPVLYFDAGEQDAAPLVPYFLHDAAGPSAATALARRFNGLAVLFEHRFYGSSATQGSYPFPLNATTLMPANPAQAYPYLTTEQALQDPVYFAHHFQPPGLEAHWPRLHPSRTPWIWLGGSYPGIRGAQMRVRNPETFYAAWASSAPTEARVDMWTYYAQAERSMTRNCSADYTAVTNYVDAVLADGTTAEQHLLKEQLLEAVQAPSGGEVNTTEARALTDVDVANYLLLPLSFYQYYGFEASVQPFCDVMETFNRTEESTTDSGGTAPPIASEGGVTLTYNVTEAWRAFLLGIAVIDYDSVPRDYSEGDAIAGNSWTWQYCSEYGYYQVGNASNPHTIESRHLSIDYFQRNCAATFPNSTLPASPNTTASNKYGGWHINPSNTLFSSGEYDPWRALSPASTEADSPRRKSVQRIPACGESPREDEVFGIVYRDMVHVSDMRALLNASDVNHRNFSTVGFSSPISTEPFYAGVGLFSMALEEWLPCFGDGAYGDMTFQFPDAAR